MNEREKNVVQELLNVVEDLAHGFDSLGKSFLDLDDPDGAGRFRDVILRARELLGENPPPGGNGEFVPDHAVINEALETVMRHAVGDYPEDDWFSLRDDVDLNLYTAVVDDSGHPYRFAVLYPVVNRRTDTSRFYSLDISGILAVADKLREQGFDECPVCHGTIYPWDSGCQNCLD